MQTATQTGRGSCICIEVLSLWVYRVHVNDLLAAFRVIPQPGVPAEEAGAAIAAESSTGTRYVHGRPSNPSNELVSGEETQYISYIAYPLDLLRIRDQHDCW